MPWTPQQFKNRHFGKASKKQALAASRQANAMLRAGVPDSIAIPTAIKHAKQKPNYKIKT